MMVRQFNINLKYAAIVILLLCSQIPSAWAGTSYSSKDLYYLAQKSYYQLKKSPDKQKFRHHWQNVIEKFSKVVERYPKSQQAYKATFTMARLYEGLNEVSKNAKDLDQSLHYYRKVSREYSEGTLTDDALFNAARIYKDKKDLSTATDIFKTIYEKYPKGDQARKARLEYQRLVSVAPVRVPKKQAVVYNKMAVVKEDKTKAVPALESIKPSYSDNKKAEALTEAKNTEPVVAQQVVRVQSESLDNKNKASSSTELKNGKKELTPQVVAKKVVVTKVELSPKPLVKKVLFPKGKGGHLYAPSSDKAQDSVPLIVVDAGHGGKDQGAKSDKGVYEKDINLTIARHVKTILVNRFKYRVVMTRKDDTFIPLKERSEIANNRNAELFVSIHANAAKRKSAHGIETYFLGTTHNDDALATAARENGELVYSVKDDKVQQILASLITTTKINDSSRLAGTVQENLYRSSRKKFRELKNLGVKEGPFYVLHGADMPSILVEVGFLTNRKEARMLSKQDYLYRQASAIAEGIHKFMLDKGPSI